MKRFTVVLLVAVAALLAVPTMASAMSRSVTSDGVTKTIVYKPKSGTIILSLSSVWAQYATPSKIIVEFNSPNGWERLFCPKTVCRPYQPSPDEPVCTCEYGAPYGIGFLPGGGVYTNTILQFPPQWLAQQARKRRLRITGESDWGNISLAVNFSH